MTRGQRLGAYLTMTAVFALFGGGVRVWFLAREGINQPIPFDPVFIWCIFLGIFRDGLLAAIIGSPLLLGLLPRRSGWGWTLLVSLVLLALTVALYMFVADVEFMRFYQVHASAYFLSYLRELGPLTDSMGSLLAPWEWLVGFLLIPASFLAIQIWLLRRRPAVSLSPRRKSAWLVAAMVAFTLIAGNYNYLMTRWFTRDALAYHLSNNVVFYLVETLRNPKYAAPPVPDRERFDEALALVREALGHQPADADSRQPWYYLSDDYALVRGTAHHACQLGLAEELAIDCRADADGDGYPVIDDCDDTRAEVHPGAIDQPLNRDDEDCDGIDSARPNVVIVLLESHRGVNIGAFASDGRALPESGSPDLDRLAERGLLFQNFYANGLTTARAVLATLCSIHPHIGPMLMRDYNYLTLPSLGTFLRARGYIGTYMHSGDTRFDNKRRWLLQWFDEIHDMTNTFTDAAEVSSWGVADPVMFDFALRWADRWAERERPFFMVLFTVINHHPFRVPPDFDSPYPHDSDNTYHRFINTMTYQDRATGDFIRQASSRAWYDNTYFVVLSDTGQVMGERDVYNDLGRLPPYEASMWIPLLLMGPGLDPSDSNGDVRRQVASQIDVAPTLLDLLGIVTPNPFAGRTLLEPVPYDQSLALMSNPYGDVWVALRRGDFKTLHGRESGTTQRFNLRTDPWERVDLVETEGYDPSEDVRLLDAWVDVQEYLVFHNLFWDPRFSVAE